MPAQARRNILVERAVAGALQKVDDFISGEKVELPNPKHRRACDELLEQQSPSVRTASLFLTFYWLEDPKWDLKTVPVGIRGEHGDKKLSEELTNRNITLHGSITAFGENLGWKGNVRNVVLSRDPRFNKFLEQVADADPDERRRIAHYLAQRFAESKVEATPLPPVGPDVLTFARAKALFHHLLGLPSEGHVPQFLIAGLLHEYRRRHTIEVRTHHPHAADKYDEIAGDIVEVWDNRVVRAYDVTARDDWKNRISNFRNKMDRFGLPKYVIIATGVNEDEEWSVPAKMALALEPYGRDIAVVDIHDVVNFLSAELTPEELRAAVNKTYDYLSDQKLSGREDIKAAYRDAVRQWLDTAEAGSAGEVPSAERRATPSPRDTRSNRPTI